MSVALISHYNKRSSILELMQGGWTSEYQLICKSRLQLNQTNNYQLLYLIHQNILISNSYEYTSINFQVAYSITRGASL